MRGSCALHFLSLEGLTMPQIHGNDAGIEAAEMGVRTGEVAVRGIGTAMSGKALLPGALQKTSGR